MKFFSFIYFLLLPLPGFVQEVNVGSVELNLKLPYKPAMLSVVGDRSQSDLQIKSNISGVTIQSLPSGYYKVLFNTKCELIVLKDSIAIRHGQSLTLHVSSDSCLYTYSVGYIPKCPHGHTDNILPIIYGLYITTHRKNGYSDSSNSDREYYTGGCLVSDCDPKYYCKIHQTKF